MMKRIFSILGFVFIFISCQELPPEAYFIDKYKITGTVDIDPKIKDKCSGTLFIIVRKGASIQPLAVKKKVNYSFPLNFSISPADVLIPQRANEFIDELIIMARISKSGSPMPQKGDCESSVLTVNAGDRNIKLFINSVRE
jgi:hypothetical protein